jgi:hypothetical protein
MWNLLVFAQALPDCVIEVANGATVISSGPKLRTAGGMTADKVNPRAKEPKVHALAYLVRRPQLA